MDWLQSITRAIQYMEDNLLNALTVEDVANHVFSSSAHFQRVFNLVTGITLGEYMRNRRLSLAGRDLLNGDASILDIAMKYQYDASESFSKAFVRFHGVKPSEVKLHRAQLQFFYPITINVSIKGGFDMGQNITDAFYWNTDAASKPDALGEQEKYQRITDWALNARKRNPDVFDRLTEWILTDAEWSSERLAENEQILLQGVLARFKEQNAQLRSYLKRITSPAIVNPAVFEALERFDYALDGHSDYAPIQAAVTEMLADFSVMKDRRVREQIAGGKTGPSGTDSAELYGYVNQLKELDAGVQWTLFMPDTVKRQQNGFTMASFEYMKLPNMRFIGFEGEEYADPDRRVAKMNALDALTDYRSGFDYDLLLMHFFGKCVDVGEWHGTFGRFFKENTPVPEGYMYFDFLNTDDGKEGPPYLSQFAYAVFTGDTAAMHREDGYDGDAMYDVTRNTILAQGKSIPYPAKYWTAEVFLNGCDKPSTAYLFSTIGDND